MFLFKIGKEKLKYKLTISMHKIKFAQARTLNNGQYFKVQVTRQVRGSHSASFTTQPVRKAQIKCKKQLQIIPLTLFYDRDDKTFLDKEMEIVGYLMNDVDEVEAELGKATVNLSEYVNFEDKSSETFVLQIQLTDQKDRLTTIKFHVNIQKQEDDNRSVQSSENNQIISRREDSKQKKIVNNNKGKVCKVNTSESSSRMDLYSKETSPDRQDRRASFNKQKPKGSSQLSKRQQQPKQQPNIHYEKEEGFFKMNTPSMSRKPLAQDQDQTKTVDLNSSKKNIGSARPPLPDRKTRDKDNTEEGQSQQLKLFLAEKTTREKEKELQIAKRQILSHKKVIEQLMQDQHRQLQSSEASKYLREIQFLKNQLLQANVRISELQTSVRHYQQQERDHSELIEKQAKKILFYKQMVEREKLHVARIMQKGLQSGDNELISFIEEAIADNDND